FLRVGARVRLQRARPRCLAYLAQATPGEHEPRRRLPPRLGLRRLNELDAAIAHHALRVRSSIDLETNRESERDLFGTSFITENDLRRASPTPYSEMEEP